MDQSEMERNGSAEGVWPPNFKSHSRFLSRCDRICAASWSAEQFRRTGLPAHAPHFKYLLRKTPFYTPSIIVSSKMILSIVLPFLILFGLSYVSLRRRPPKGYRPVPGPKGLPLIGNTLDVPQSRPEKKFMEWAREFGELYRIQMGWNDWVFVNSDVAAKVRAPHLDN